MAMENPYKIEQRMCAGDGQWGCVNKCPVCGSDSMTLTDYTYPYPDGEVHEIIMSCDGCSAETEDYSNIAEVINAWNNGDIG